MKGINVYKKQSVTASSNEELVLRLYEKSIVIMWEAHELLEAGDKISIHGASLSIINVFEETVE